MGCSKCQIAWPNGVAEGRGTEGTSTGECRILARSKKFETPDGSRRSRPAFCFCATVFRQIVSHCATCSASPGRRVTYFAPCGRQKIALPSCVVPFVLSVRAVDRRL